MGVGDGRASSEMPSGFYNPWLGASGMRQSAARSWDEGKTCPFEIGYREVDEEPGSGSGSGSGETKKTQKKFFTHCYYQREQMVYLMGDVEVTDGMAGKIVWLEMSTTGPQTATVRSGTLLELQSRAANPSYSVVALYKFAEGSTEVEVDLRCIPTMPEWMTVWSGP